MGLSAKFLPNIATYVFFLQSQYVENTKRPVTVGRWKQCAYTPTPGFHWDEEQIRGTTARFLEDTKRTRSRSFLTRRVRKTKSQVTECKI